jgi:hypothetical protein
VAELERRALGEGAAGSAPTAPHATPRPREDGGRRTGPERFWARWPVRLALGASLIVSGVAHCSVVPFEIPRGFEVNDVEGQAAIPVDLFEQAEAPPEPPPPPAPAEESKPPAEETKGPGPAALPPSRRDAGAQLDAGADAPPDALVTDAATDAPADGAPLPDGAIPLAEGGVASAGPKDPQAIVGAAGDIQVDAVLVMVVINAEVVRTNPVGATLGSLLRGIPQWDQFMHGTDIDPVGDTDWVMISGPSLVNTSRDVVLIHYSVSDAKVDRAMEVVGANYAKGGPYDAGVPTVKAVRTYADGSERVVLRPRSHVLAVVPPAVADKVARQLTSASVPAHIRKGEAAYVRVVNPHHPMPMMPAAITEARLRVVPRDDEGADVYIDCDTKDADTAAATARDLQDLAGSYGWVSIFVPGLFDHLEVAPEGNVAKVHAVVTRRQIEMLVGVVAKYLSVGAPPPGGQPAPRPAPPGGQPAQRPAPPAVPSAPRAGTSGR